MSLFRMESVARWRVTNGHYDENQEDPILDEINAIDYPQMRQVLIFRRFPPQYLNDLMVLNGLSQNNIWKLNGHDR